MRCPRYFSLLLLLAVILTSFGCDSGRKKNLADELFEERERERLESDPEDNTIYIPREHIDFTVDSMLNPETGHRVRIRRYTVEGRGVQREYGPVYRDFEATITIWKGDVVLVSEVFRKWSFFDYMKKAAFIDQARLGAFYVNNYNQETGQLSMVANVCDIDGDDCRNFTLEYIDSSRTITSGITYYPNIYDD